MNWMNTLIGAGLLIAALANFLTVGVVGAAGIALGGLNFINGLRRRIRTWQFYAMCWAAVYFGGHILIAALDGELFSGWAAGWTVAWFAILSFGIWRNGGALLDATILVSALPEEGDFDINHYLKSLPKDLTPLSIILITAWQRTGRAFFRFLRFALMIEMLVGLYFLFCPPSLDDWKMFGVVVISFIAYITSKSDSFDWNKWHRVSSLALGLGILLTIAHPWINSYSLPFYQKAVGPTTSSYAITTDNTTAWADNTSTPVNFKKGTWLLIVEGAPHMDKNLGLRMILVRPAMVAEKPKLWGFSQRVFRVVEGNVQRVSSLEGDAESMPSFKSTESRALLIIALVTISVCLLLSSYIRKSPQHDPETGSSITAHDATHKSDGDHRTHSGGHAGHEGAAVGGIATAVAVVVISGLVLAWLIMHANTFVANPNPVIPAPVGQVVVQQAPPPPPTSPTVAPPQAPVVTTAPVVNANWVNAVEAKVPDPSHSAEESYSFTLLVNPQPNRFDYLLDGRVKLVDQYAIDSSGKRLTLAPGDTVDFSADPNSRICEHNAPCAGPMGQSGLIPALYSVQDQANYHLSDYPVANAVLGQLCAIIGEERIPVGLYKRYVVPANAGIVHIRLGANIRDSFAYLAHGGQRVTVTINPDK